MAEETATYDDFKAKVEEFFNQPDEVEEFSWAAALAKIRSKEFVPEPPFADLPRGVPEDKLTEISVQRLDIGRPVFTSADNVQDSYMLPTAA